MIQFIKVFTALLVLGFVWVPGNLDANDDQTTVQIRILEQANMATDDTILIKDVAEVTGGTYQLRNKIANLDLDKFANGQTSMAIGADQIKYRLILGGVAQRAFAISGARQASVRLQSPNAYRQRLETLLTEQLANQFGIQRDAITVTLDELAINTLSRSGIELTSASAHANFGIELPVGKRTIDISLREPGGKAANVRLPITVSIVRDLVMATRNIPRGDTIQESDIARVRRPVSDRNVRFASFDQIVGQVARNEIQQYAVVRSHYIQPPRKKPTTFIIRRNRLLNAVVRQGAIVVHLKNVKSMTEGNVGDSIEILNPLTGKRMLATVLNANTVEIQ